MEDRELAADRIAAPHQGIGRPGETGDLELQVILVRPEPGHFAVGPGPTHHAVGGVLGLVDGVLHTFQANLMAVAADMAGGGARPPRMWGGWVGGFVLPKALPARPGRRPPPLLA